ncbi:hypothetical protein [Mesorhizobium australicum]|uniref:Uncharacterized protein n=1 Tax=Mesorhizobium australicum TaxID=536018 RepID=A0A1X7P024_9HYPH|nr:hypothetical protein [Mesorhizobium australicum]SMH43473.1 hypothetical protein SAMN02982922_2911 [Mesorhizobium australicum]
MSNVTFILAYAMSDGVAVAHSESAWDALLRGELDAALGAAPRYLDPTTGKELSQRQVARIWATASAPRRPALAEQFESMADRIYGGDGPWARRRP